MSGEKNHREHKHFVSFENSRSNEEGIFFLTMRYRTQSCHFVVVLKERFNEFFPNHLFFFPGLIYQILNKHFY